MTDEQREIMLRGLELAAAYLRKNNIPSFALDVEDAIKEIERLTAANAEKAEAIRALLPHIVDNDAAGETDFERLVQGLAALVADESV